MFVLAAVSGFEFEFELRHAQLVRIPTAENLQQFPQTVEAKQTFDNQQRHAGTKWIDWTASHSNNTHAARQQPRQTSKHGT